MKKAGILIIFLLFLNILAITLIQAQEMPVPIPGELDPETGLPVGVPSNIDEAKEKTQTQTEYLKQEWKEMLLDKPVIGPVINIIDGVFSALNPFFKVILGVDYGLSWAFIFALTIWIVLFIFIYQPASGMFDSKIYGLIASFAIASLIGIAGVIKGAVNFLSLIITKKWLFWVAIILTILISMIIIKLSGGLKKILMKEAEEAKTREAQKTIQVHGELSKKELKNYSK